MADNREPLASDDSALGIAGQLSEVLLEDVNACDRAIADSGDPGARRNLVRAIFAHMEGTCWVLKQVALSEQRDGWVSFSPGEAALLEDTAFELDEKGKVKRRAAKLTFARNLQFALHTFASAHGYDLTIPTGDQGWSDLMASAKVRDRLMHPKGLQDLQVTDIEVTQVRSGHRFFLFGLLGLLRAAGDSYKARVSEFRAAADRAKSHADLNQRKQEVLKPFLLGRKP